MNINRDFVTLGLLKDEVPPFVRININQLPYRLRSFFYSNYMINAIFVKRGEQFVELPFVDGMRWNIFVHMMRHCSIWNKKVKTTVMLKELNNLGLKLIDNKVWYQTEEEMLK